jgi:hypothetical protein
MMRTLKAHVLCAAISFGALGCAVEDTGERQQAVSGAPDPVLAFNALAAQLIVGPGGANKVPPLGLTDLAIVHAAIYDAVNAADGFPYEPYAIRVSVIQPASNHAAAAAAGHDVLLALYPARQADIDAAYATSLSYVPDGDEKDHGIAAGQQAAAGILLVRANDGRNAPTAPYSTDGAPGHWVPTPPGFLPAQAPQARFITPFTMSSPDEFRAPPPPSLDSHEWVRAYNEVKALGNAGVNTRTPEQTDIGKFWGDQPMLQWNRAWRKISIDQGLSISENARYFAMLGTASADSLIACWDSKYFYGFWRPDTAIPAGGGNSRLTADPTWISLVVTPPHPEYPAAHGCFSGASTHTLRAFFDTDDFDFTVDSNFAGVVQPVRSYSSFSDALDEVKDARIYGGMHHRFSVNEGGRMGREIVKNMKHNFFRPSHGHH